MRRAVILLLCCAASGAYAQDVTTSLRPPPNPALGPAAAAPGAERPVGPALAEADAPRPKARPVALAAASGGATPATEASVSAAPAAVPVPPPQDDFASSLRPRSRPPALTTKIAALAAPSPAAGLDLSSSPDGNEVELAAVTPPTARERRQKKRAAASMQGAVCGVPSIKGQDIKRITAEVRGCGVEDPVAVTSIAGVRLSQTATVDCSIAKAMNSWVDEVAQPAFDGKLVEVQVAAHYVCRSRNNISGGKISEHGKGRALDIAAFVMADGTVLTVENDYNRLLRRIYKAACSYFRTTLGPGSDGYHENHFHFDTSDRSGGSYCR